MDFYDFAFNYTQVTLLVVGLGLVLVPIFMFLIFHCIKVFLEVVVSYKKLVLVNLRCKHYQIKFKDYFHIQLKEKRRLRDDSSNHRSNNSEQV